MKAVLYEGGEVLSEDEWGCRDEKLPLWYIQVPETDAERAVLTYAINGLLGQDNKMELCRNNSQCRASLLITGNWDDEGKLAGAIQVEHKLSREEQQTLIEQLQKRQRKGLPLTTRKVEPLVIESYSITPTYQINAHYGAEYHIRAGFVEEAFPFCLSILFPYSEEKAVDWLRFRVLYYCPINPYTPVVLKESEVQDWVLGITLPVNHFHYRELPRPSASFSHADSGTAVEENMDDYENDSKAWLDSLSYEALNNLDMND